MSEHTRGPWKVGETRHDYDCVIRNADNDPVCLTVVAGYTRKTAKANAQLIAASPDLVYELGGIADALAANETVTIEPGSVKAARIAAAIAKAEPQQPTEATTDSPPERVPAEGFPVSEYIIDGMVAHDWNWDELARRMGEGGDVNRCTLDILQLNDPRIHLGEATAAKLAKAFGGDAQTWLNLDKAWRKWKTAQQPITNGGKYRRKEM